LRRASVAGLATFATAAVVVASAGSAFGFATGTASGGGSLTAGSSVTVFPGVASQSINNLTLALKDGTTAAGNGWANGDSITLQVNNQTAGTELCNTAGNTNAKASLAVPAVAASDSVGPTAFTNFTVTQAPGANCNVNDTITVHLTAGAPADTGTTTFTISGLSLSLGTNFPTTPTSVTVQAVASNNLPFGTVGAGTVSQSVTVASVGSNSVSASPVVGAANGTTGVAISPIVVTDVTGGTITVGIKFTANAGDTFAASGTLAAPTGVTVTGPSETLPSLTQTYLIAAGTVPAGGKFTLTGATVNLANSAISHKVTVGTAAGEATLVGAATEYATTAAQVRTFAGVDRYGTARALYHSAFAARTVAVVTSGANYPDALSAGVLAKKNTTGVLLTDPNTLSQDTMQELQADPISTVYIIGGTAAVSQNVQNAIAALHVSNTPANPLINVVRIAGADRYATNNEVNLTAGPSGGKAIIATGANFADALAVGPVLYDQNYALVLTDPASLSASAQSTLTNLGITHVIIAGGTSAVSANVETQLGKAGITVDYRIAGADRTDTAAKVATWATAGLAASGSYAALNTGGFTGWPAARSTALLTRGDTFADALAAGPVAGLAKEVLVLTANPSTLGAGAATYLGGLAGTVTTISTLGFAAAVTPATVNAATAALG